MSQGMVRWLRLLSGSPFQAITAMEKEHDTLMILGATYDNL